MRQFITSHKADWAALAIIFIAVIAFHWRGLQPGYAFLPIDNVNNNRPWRTGPFVLGDLQNQLIGDPIYQFYPFLNYAVASIRNGQWPLWNSKLLLGHPAAGDPLYQTFYPVYLALGLIFGPARGLTYGAVWHVVLAGSLTYAWLRSLAHSLPASMLGAVTYALSGFMVTWLETPFWVSTLSWLPGVLWMVERALQGQRWRDVALAALLLGLATLGGQFSFIALFSGFLLAYIGWRSVNLRTRWIWALSVAGVTLVLGLAVGVMQILPFAEALQTSHRVEGVAFVSLPPTQLITLLTPNFYGNPSTTGAYWGAGNFSEAILYAGVIGLVLSLVAVLQTRLSSTWFWLGTALVLGYMAYGGPGITSWAQVPGLNLIAPNRCLYILPLFVAGLAASAMDSQALSWKSIFMTVFGLGAVLIWAVNADWSQAGQHWNELTTPLATTALWLGAGMVLLVARERWPIWRTGWNWLIVGVAFIDLYSFGYRYNPALPVRELPQPTPAIEYVQVNATHHRIATQQQSGDLIFGPNYLTVFGLSDISGYSSLLPAPLVKLVRAGDPLGMGYNGNTIWLGQPSERLLDLLQARFIVSPEPVPLPEPKAERLASDCEAATAEITNAQALTGSFTVRQLAINRLDIPFQTVGQTTPALLNIQMWSGLHRERLVLQSQLETTSIQSNPFATFYFAPEKEAAGQTYLWEISTAAPRTGLAVCANSQGETEFSVYGTDQLSVFEGELFVTERVGMPPRAYVIYVTETVPDEQQALARLLDPAFDLSRVAITAGPPSQFLTDSAPATRATLLRYSDTEVEITARLERRGLLVLGDYFYPGWNAYVDGQRAEVLRTNLLWRGVELAAGEHTIVFRYEPLSVTIGLGVSGVAFGLIGLLVAVDVFRRRG